MCARCEALLDERVGDSGIFNRFNIFLASSEEKINYKKLFVLFIPNIYDLKAKTVFVWLKIF